MAAIKRFIRRHSMGLSLTTLLFLFGVVLLADKIFISIPAGHSGVLWERFRGGTDVNNMYGEGFHIIFPWNKMTVYNIRLNEATSTFQVLAKDGLKIDIEFLVRYRPDEKQLGFLHKHLGENYLNILVVPEIAAKGRAVMAKYSPEQIYSSERYRIQETVEREVKEELQVLLAENHASKNLIFLEDVLIKNILLPQTVRLAIEAKVEHKHRMLQYEYILKREEQESKRKAIEAKGIRQFQDIIKDGISNRYLKWKGIDATLELARSHNSKVVVIGAGDSGMPLILGNMGDNAVSTAAATNDKDWQRKFTSEKPDAIGIANEPSQFNTQEDKSFAKRALEKLSLNDVFEDKQTGGQNNNNDNKTAPEIQKETKDAPKTSSVSPKP